MGLAHEGMLQHMDKEVVVGEEGEADPNIPGLFVLNVWRQGSAACLFSTLIQNRGRAATYRGAVPCCTLSKASGELERTREKVEENHMRRRRHDLQKRPPSKPPNIDRSLGGLHGLI